MTEKQKATIKKLREENEKLNKENRQLKKERNHFKSKFDELWQAVENLMPKLNKLNGCLESTQTGIKHLEVVSMALSPRSSIE